MVKAYQVSFQVADALDQPFPDGQFDPWIVDNTCLTKKRWILLTLTLTFYFYHITCIEFLTH